MSEARLTRGTAPLMTMSAYENALKQFGQAVEVLGLTQNQVAMIKDPRRMVELNLPVRMDDGSIQIFQTPVADVPIAQSATQIVEVARESGRV